jgi:flagellar basal-body rod protein FlgF
MGFVVPVMSQGLGISIQGMVTPMQQLMANMTNIANYGTPGYQRVQNFQTALTEVAGPYALRTVVDQSHGRIRRSGNPLDVAINSKGYFHRLSFDGHVEPVRDGRFHLDRDGFLVSLDEKKILSANGQPIQLPYFPESIDTQLRITPTGELVLFDGRTGERDFVTRLGVFDQEGSLYTQPDLKQHYVEDSNVLLPVETTQMLPLRRTFEANKQLFVMQNDNLNKVIQELGRAG